MSKLTFIPSSPLVKLLPLYRHRAANVMPKTASHWFGDVLNIFAAGLTPHSFNGLKVKVLMWRVINHPLSFYFLDLVLVDDR